MADYWYPTAFSCWSGKEEAAMDRVRASGRYTMGPEVEAFEHEFAAFHGKSYGIAVNSGSSANLVAVAALFAVRRLRRGDKVIVPAMAWSTTYAPLVQYGLDLILIDVDDTWNAPVAKLHYKPELVMACSILGNPAYLWQWEVAAKQLGAAMIEDNCESLGAICGTALDDRLCGTFGMLSTFSFFYSHQISAIEGGMILTNDSRLAEKCRSLRAHGWTRDIKEPERFEDEYNFEEMGFNVRPLEQHAAVAREQLKKLPTFTEARRRNAALFREMMAGLPITCPPWNGKPSPFGLHFTVDAGQQARGRLVAALREAGIDCRLPTGGSFHRHAYGRAWADHATPNADRVHDCGLFIGNAPWNIADKIERAVGVMKMALAREAV